jgi:hypothetical protein
MPIFVNNSPFAVSVHGGVRVSERVISGGKVTLRENSEGWAVDTWGMLSEEERAEWVGYRKDCFTIIADFGSLWGTPKALCRGEAKIDFSIHDNMEIFTFSLKDDGVLTKAAARRETEE